MKIYTTFEIQFAIFEWNDREIMQIMNFHLRYKIQEIEKQRKQAQWITKKIQLNIIPVSFQRATSKNPTPSSSHDSTCSGK